MSENDPPTEAGVPLSHLGLQSGCRMVLNTFQESETARPFTPQLPLTPVLNITSGFANLSTLAGDTPRRCLDLSNLSNEEEEIVFNFSESSRTLETDQKGSVELQDQFRGSRRQCVPLLQSQVLCSTPGTPRGIHCVTREISSPSVNKENEDRLFKHPGWHMPRSLLFRKRLTDSQLACNNAMLEAGDLEMRDFGSPIATVAPSRVPESLDSFPEIFPNDQGEAEPLTGHLSSMASLLSGPLLTQDINISEVSVNKSRLFRSPSLPEKLNRLMLKRAIKVQDDQMVAKVKWKRSPIQEETDGIMFLKKTASLSDIEIVKALDQDYSFRQLIGDFSNVYSLPTISGRHQDLRYITSETMAALIYDQFQSLIEKFFIIDCRYPYEYHGGHIKGAFNIHRQDDLFDFFLKKPLLPSVPQKRLILVFHCEYSSERGPKMCRYLREEDRAMNEYPALHYPELYVLQGGYKDFFLAHKDLCDPQSYCPMHHQDFKAELLKFRVKSKTWAGTRKRKDYIAHLMKL
ncbi:M-phase inducer phosphatase 3 isoform X3 [Sceloporus undulatus]|uniref:M-phase inducer phosphatase 3 isoform X3 n=1 Tax=Sceloporus undulatus TaxID=8520 RepID=UPI001C4C8ABF|nr:M-phase inducer phosphatase 3 isoform X3 [Sceloporus undulatus]